MFHHNLEILESNEQFSIIVAIAIPCPIGIACNPYLFPCLSSSLTNFVIKTAPSKNVNLNFLDKLPVAPRGCP